MRIVFMGSPEFSVPTLQALMDSDHEVVAVYSQPPRAAGRGKKERPTPVHALAEAAGLEVRTPLNFKDPKEVAEFAALNADIAVVIAYGLILPQALLDAPKFGCVNLHASLLPRWRGAAPIHRAIMAGDSETGVCLMQMEAGLDTGPVLAKVTAPINRQTTTGELHQVLAELSAKLLVENLDQIETLTPVTQADEGVIYADKISKSESEINWGKSADEVKNHIHGLSPFPGAWSTFRGERIKFHQVENTVAHADAGNVIDDQFSIACGSEAIRPITLQREGKRAMPASEVLRGLEFNIGDHLGETK